MVLTQERGLGLDRLAQEIHRMIQIDLSGKTAVITGAASGLGAEMARKLGAAGAAVVVNYSRNAAGAEGVAAGIRSARSIAASPVSPSSSLRMSPARPCR